MINIVTRVINKLKLTQAIEDTGTAGNFVLSGAPVDEVQEAENPIEIEMANGSISKSTHKYVLPADLRTTQRIKGGAQSARPSPFFPDINEKVI